MKVTRPPGRVLMLNFAKLYYTQGRELTVCSGSEPTFIFATDTSVIDVCTVVNGSGLAVNKPGLISNASHIIQKD